MPDTRFHAEFYIDKQGYLTGRVRFPKDDSATLEALNAIIDEYAKRLETSHHDVMNLIRRQHNESES
jgi:hypothetical protein